MKMRKRIDSGHGLMLFELLIAIGFFAVFATIILRLFISAQQISLQSNNLSRAIMAAENAAECVKAGTEPAVFYNEDWVPSEQNESAYRLTLETVPEEGVSTTIITVKDKADTEIFSLTVKTLQEAGA